MGATAPVGIEIESCSGLTPLRAFFFFLIVVKDLTSCHLFHFIPHSVIRDLYEVVKGHVFSSGEDGSEPDDKGLDLGRVGCCIPLECIIVEGIGTKDCLAVPGLVEGDNLSVSLRRHEDGGWLFSHGGEGGVGGGSIVVDSDSCNEGGDSVRDEGNLDSRLGDGIVVVDVSHRVEVEGLRPSNS